MSINLLYGANRGKCVYAPDRGMLHSMPGSRGPPTQNTLLSLANACGGVGFQFFLRLQPVYIFWDTWYATTLMMECGICHGTAVVALSWFLQWDLYHLWWWLLLWCSRCGRFLFGTFRRRGGIILNVVGRNRGREFASFARGRFEECRCVVGFAVGASAVFCVCISGQSAIEKCVYGLFTLYTCSTMLNRVGNTGSDKWSQLSILNCAQPASVMSPGFGVARSTHI